MATAALTLRAFDLGSVQGEGITYRSVGFDLTQVSGRVTACWIRLESVPSAAGLRVGEAARHRTFLAPGPVDATGGATLCRKLTACGAAVVNSALGGYLSLDTWGGHVCSGSRRGALYLELETVACAVERSAA